MNTDSPNPDHEELKALLAQSFHAEEAEDVPPLPDDLRDRIRDQYGKEREGAPAAPPAEAKAESILDKIRNFFASPAYAGAAAALILVAVAAVLLRPDKTETIRGDHDPNAKPIVMVYLYGLDADELKDVQESLFFNKTSLVVVDSLDTAREATKPKVIVNGESDRIEHFPTTGEAPTAKAFPAKAADLDEIVADAVGDVRSVEKETE